MARVAKIVTISLMTRVIVEDTATDEEIMLVAIPRFKEKLEGDGICDNIEEIVDDEEMPFGTGLDDK